MSQASPSSVDDDILRVTVGFIFYAHGVDKLFALDNVRGLFTAVRTARSSIFGVGHHYRRVARWRYC